MPQVEKLRIRVEEGVESDAALFGPEGGASPRAVIVCTPAMAVPARFYEPLGRALAGRGLGMVTADLRGVATSSIRPRRGVDFGYHELAFQDLPAVIAAARGAWSQAPIFLLGHSLGGQVSTLYASAQPEGVRGLILVASGSPYFRIWPFPKSLGVLAGTQIMRGVSSLLGYFPGRRLSFAGTEARRLIHEWASFALNGRLRGERIPEDIEARLREFERPLLAISFDDDRLAPKPAMDHLISKMPRAELTRRHLRPSEVGVPVLSHFQWAKQPAPVAELIAEWVHRAR